MNASVHTRIQQLAVASRVDELPAEEREILHERSAAAAASFRSALTSGQRDMLLSAASGSNLLFLALAGGNWEAAVRALRGYVVRAVPQEEWLEYRELIVALNVQTPLGLETSGHRQIDRDDERILAAA